LNKNWGTEQYEYISRQLKNITKGFDPHLHEDFIQEVLLIFWEHPLKDQLLISGDWKYYIIRIGLNNFHSTTSRFHKKYRQPIYEFNDEIEVENDEYDMDYDLMIERGLLGLDRMLKSNVEQHRSLAMIIMLYHSTGENMSYLSKLLETDRSNLRKNYKKGLEILKEYISDDINPNENISNKLLNNKTLKEVFMKKQNKKQVYEKWIIDNRLLFFNPSMRNTETNNKVYEIYNYFYNTNEKPKGCGSCIANKYNHFKELYF
jgi:hypothetical protein